MSNDGSCALAVVALLLVPCCGSGGEDRPHLIAEDTHAVRFQLPVQAPSPADGGTCELAGNDPDCAPSGAASAGAAGATSLIAGKVKLGSRCSFSRECVTHAWCGTATHRCEVVTAVWGTSCVEDAQCGELFCVAGAASALQCGLSPTPCDTADDCSESRHACETGAKWKCSASCTKGLCQVRP